MLIALAALAVPVQAQPRGSVLRMQALNPSGEREGTCFVVHQEARGDHTLVTLLTSARLFDRDAMPRARIFLDATHFVEVEHAAVATPYANMRDVAVLKATITGAALEPLPLVFDQAKVGTLFVISGRGIDGQPALVAEHVRFAATRAVIGDRTTGALAGCLGAPAIVERGVFGIVSECQSDRGPEITPLAVSEGFLARSVPGITARPSDEAQFTVEEREINGPALEVNLGETLEGEVDVPFDLGKQEAVLGATARLVSRTALPVATVTVLSLDDRVVKLRFTVGGPPPPTPPASWPAAQALIVVRMSLVVLPKF
jgi:hypothetical protein